MSTPYPDYDTDPTAMRLASACVNPPQDTLTVRNGKFSRLSKKRKREPMRLTPNTKPSYSSETKGDIQ